MNNNWQAFLEKQQFADHAETCTKLDLSSFYGIIKVSGDDKVSFLQGQTTNDIREISPENSQLNSYCTPKGRMIANFRILQKEDDFLIVIPLQRLEPVLKRLKMFVLMSKVTLDDVSDELVILGLYGDCFATEHDGWPVAVDSVIRQGDSRIIRVAGDQARFMVISTPAEAEKIWESEKKATPVNTDYWRLQDIRAGIPVITDKTVEAFIPQMVNMQQINGVSFTKGCFTGQEIVARMQYLGKLKRRMYIIDVDSETPPQAGDALFSSQSSSGQGSGKIVDIIQTGDRHYTGLAVIEIARFEDKSLQLHDENGPEIAISLPPYEFESNES